MTSRIFRSDMLKGQVALVTGGGTGIGAAIARQLAWTGATVVIASRKAEHIEPAAAGLSEQVGATVHGRLCNLRDRDSVTACAEGIVADLGRLDIVVNNGGGQFLAPAEHIRPKGWDAVIETNLTGTWNMTRAAADAWMLKHGGRVINITMLTQRGFPGMTHSVASRAGVEAMTRSLAVEWASKNIQLNCVQPGIIASNGMRNYPSGEEMARAYQSEVPAKRLGTCEEVAEMVAFLAGPGGAYVTGQILTVDGGRALWGRTWPIPDPHDPMPAVELPVEPWER